MQEKQGITISESLTLAGTVYRILKSQKPTLLVKKLLTKQINLINLSCCDKYHYQLYVDSTRYLPYFVMYHQSPIDI